MAKEKKDRLSKQMRTPLATAAFAHVHKKDTEGKYATNKYKVTLKFPKDGGQEVKDFLNTIKDMWEETDQVNDLPIKDGDERDDERDHGFWLVTAKSDYAPGVVDAAKKKLSAEEGVRGGDKVKAMVNLAEYYFAPKKATGLTVYLNAVQLIERGGFDATEGFEDESEGEDAYVSDEDASEGFEDEEQEAPARGSKNKKRGGKKTRGDF